MSGGGRVTLGTLTMVSLRLLAVSVVGFSVLNVALDLRPDGCGIALSCKIVIQQRLPASPAKPQKPKSVPKRAHSGGSTSHTSGRATQPVRGASRAPTVQLAVSRKPASAGQPTGKCGCGGQYLSPSTVRTSKITTSSTSIADSTATTVDSEAAPDAGPPPPPPPPDMTPPNIPEPTPSVTYAPTTGTVDVQGGSVTVTGASGSVQTTAGGSVNVTSQGGSVSVNGSCVVVSSATGIVTTGCPPPPA